MKSTWFLSDIGILGDRWYFMQELFSRWCIMGTLCVFSRYCSWIQDIDVLVDEILLLKPECYAYLRELFIYQWVLSDLVLRGYYLCGAIIVVLKKIYVRIIWYVGIRWFFVSWCIFLDLFIGALVLELVDLEFPWTFILGL
jgi:hypothetical protein